MDRVILQFPSGTAPAPDSGLSGVVQDWQEAMRRLDQAHESMRTEVLRLTQELESKNRELTRQHRLVDLGQVAVQVAQEMRRDASSLPGFFTQLRERVAGDGKALLLLANIQSAVANLESKAADLAQFTADETVRLASVSVRDLVEEVARWLAPRLTEQRVAPVIDVNRHDAVLADRQLLRRALVNLSLNAIEAMPRGGQLVFTGYDSHSHYELEVADSGIGLSDEAKRRAFEPRYSTKRRGSGLGLTIVSRIAQLHGAEVVVQNCPEGGAAFTLRFPRRYHQAAA